jgi:hypothetical protein
MQPGRLWTGLFFLSGIGVSGRAVARSNGGGLSQ